MPSKVKEVPVQRQLLSPAIIEPATPAEIQKESLMRLIMTLITFIAFPMAAQSQKIFQEGSIGARIENELQRLNADCLGNKLKYDTYLLPKEFTLPYGPGVSLRQPVGPNTTIEGIQFDYVMRSIVDVRYSIIDQIRKSVGRAYAIDIKLPQATPLNEADSLVYNFNCASQLKLAIHQGFKFSTWSDVTPSIKQALDFQSDPKARGSILVMSGAFLSPLYVSLKAKDPAVRATAHAAILPFLASMRANNIDSQQLGYLRSLQGWIVSLGSNSETAQLLRGSLDAGASGFGFDTKVSASGRLEYSSNLSSARFLVFFDREPTAAEDVEKIPSFNAIESALNDVAQPYPATEVAYQKNGKLPLRVELPGVSDWLCLNQWEAESPDADAVDRVGSIMDPSGKCVLSTNVALSKDLHHLRMVFTNPRYRNGDGEKNALTIRKQYKVHMSSEPILARSGDAVVSLNKNAAVPSYAVEASFQIYPIGTSNQVHLPSLPTLTCDGADIKSTLYPNQVALDGSLSRYKLNMTVNFEPGAVPVGSCSLGTAIAFQSTVDGTTALIVKPLTLDLIRFAAP